VIKDKRKSLRRPVRHSAWIALEGGQTHGCVMSDVSDSGARLDIDESKPIPDQFTLLLTINGSARRKCRVVWRKPRQIGVTFEGRITDGDKATLVPKPKNDAKATDPESAKSESAKAEGAMAGPAKGQAEPAQSA
jgi:hypothetical protein